jgi:hypothetical protein
MGWVRTWERPSSLRQERLLLGPGHPGRQIHAAWHWTEPGISVSLYIYVNAEESYRLWLYLAESIPAVFVQGRSSLADVVAFVFRICQSAPLNTWTHGFFGRYEVALRWVAMIGLGEEAKVQWWSSWASSEIKTPQLNTTELKIKWGQRTIHNRQDVYTVWENVV